MLEGLNLDLAAIIADHDTEIVAAWIAQRKASPAAQGGRVDELEQQTQCRAFLSLLAEASTTTGADPEGPAQQRLRQMLRAISRSHAVYGFTPIETASFVFALKRPLFDIVRRLHQRDPAAVADATWQITLLLDGLGLYTFEAYQKSREEVIQRQQRELMELSTPVVKLWPGILALPLIGTLDSERTQVVMENLLQSIVDHSAEIAIIDITGVPTVDTLVAQHLLKTVAAARLMGADCLISGVRPQIAQTMVHLGVELNVVSKATLQAAFAVALQRIGCKVTTAREAGSVPRLPSSPN